MERRAKRTQSKKFTSRLPLGIALGTMLFALCSPVGAQQQGKVFRIGYLSSGSSSVPGRGYELFQREIRKLGYVEAKNVHYEHRYADNKHDRLLGLAGELVGLRVDVLVALSTTAALAAKNASSTIPIVFVGAGDPVTGGLQ